MGKVDSLCLFHSDAVSLATIVVALATAASVVIAAGEAAAVTVIIFVALHTTAAAAAAGAAEEKRRNPTKIITMKTSVFVQPAPATRPQPRLMIYSSTLSTFVGKLEFPFKSLW